MEFNLSKSSKIILFLFLFTLTFLIGNQNINCSIENAYTNYDSFTTTLLQYITRNNSIVIHPTINFNINSKIVEVSNKIKDELNISLKVYLIPSISSEYNDSTNSNKKDIKRFTTELSHLIYNDKIINSYSLVIVISIKDRQIRIRTGSELKKKLSNNQLTNIINEIKIYLKHQQYEEAVLYIIENIYGLVKFGKAFIDKKNKDTSKFNSYMIIIVGTILSIIFYLAINENCKKYRNPNSNQEALTRLQNIKNELNKKRPRKQFLDTTCTICIEEFEHFNEKTNEKTNEKDKKNENIKTLDCGHMFHEKCINDWMTKELTCPTCRAKIDCKDEKENIKLAEGLVNVQSIFYPSLNYSDIEYYDNDIIWNFTDMISNTNSNYNNDVADTYSVGSVGSVGSGGAGGDW